MAFDVYGLMRSEEIRNFLRENRPFTPLEQALIIWYGFYPVKQKLAFMKQLLNETEEERGNVENLVALYEFIVKFIYNPPENVIYIAMEERNGYHADTENAYRRSESILPDTGYFRTFPDLEKDRSPAEKVRVDMISLTETKGENNELVQPLWFYMMPFEGRLEVVNFGMDERWFERQGYATKELHRVFRDFFRVPLPFENGCRVRLKTPEMQEPVYGIMSSEKDCYGCWYHFLWIEDEKHTGSRKAPDSLDMSYPQIDMINEYLVYDWLERAEEQKEQVQHDNEENV